MKKGFMQRSVSWVFLVIGAFLSLSWCAAGQTIDGVYYNDAGVADGSSAPSGATYSDPSGAGAPSASEKAGLDTSVDSAGNKAAYDNAFNGANNGTYGSNTDKFGSTAKDAVTPEGVKNADQKDWTTTSKDAQKTTPADAQKATPPSWGPHDMTSTNFLFNPNDISPSERKYTYGTRMNIKGFLSNIGKTLLIAVTTIAVLSIVVGGLMISTTGPTDRAAKGKTIIMLNITAILVALFSYSIIKLVSWLIQ